MGLWTYDLPLLPIWISGKLTSKPPWLSGEWGRAQKSGPPEFKYWLTSQVPIGKQFNSKPQFTHLQNRAVVRAPWAMLAKGLAWFIAKQVFPILEIPYSTEAICRVTTVTVSASP